MTTFKKIAIIALAAVSFSSCIEETFPESSTTTSEQIAASSSALEALMSGVPSQMAQGYLVYGRQEDETDMALPGLMITYTELLGDIFCDPSANSGYDWFSNWNSCTNMGDNLIRTYIPWRSLYMFVKSANDVIKTIKSADGELNELQKAYLGMAQVYRAHAYYNLWNLYYGVENEYTDCSAVTNLTVPIVTDETAEADANNNPRATIEEMVKFIISDLDAAEQNLAGFKASSKVLPSLAVVYGMKARVYLQSKDYANAATYARKAIQESGCTPLTKAQWEDPRNGFCNASSNNSWLWCVNYAAENMGNLCNYTGWIAGEADWGYNSHTHFCINAWLFDRMGSQDIRRSTFIDPEVTDRSIYKTSRDSKFLNNMPDYGSLKFRCLNGDWENYAVGGACDVPVMRVEEMYLIEAEAVGMTQGESAGKQLLEDFMTKYRDPLYQFPSAYDEFVQNFQEEVLYQKRVEFWGEGVAFFDAKRIKAGSHQWYEGSNAPADKFHINAKGIKPNWVLPIPKSEWQNNQALENQKNPDPTGAIKPDLTKY